MVYWADLPSELEQLARQINFSQGEFTLYLARVNTPVERDRLIASLKSMLDQDGIATLEIVYSEPTRDLLPRIQSELEAVGREIPLCILVTGLEHSVRQDDPNSPILAHLNLARELYRARVPHPMVLWLPEYALTALVRIAPDFWAWRSGVFEFESSLSIWKLESQTVQAGRDYERLGVDLEGITSKSGGLLIEEGRGGDVDIRGKDIAVYEDIIIGEGKGGVQPHKSLTSGGEPGGRGVYLDDVSAGGDIHVEGVHYTLAGGTLPVPPAVRPVAPPDPFVGRARERDELARVLCDGRGAVHTLAGMGGVGKTALAARVVHDLIEADAFPGGVLWFSLETGPTANILWTHIAAAYGYPHTADMAGIARAVLNQYRPLLVGDNAESAPATARTLLDGRGAATVLLTSRDRTVTAGYDSLLYQINSLDRADAVELFLARVGAGHDPALVDELCELMGDLPLAVNLAAGYITGYDEPLAGYLALLRGMSLAETLHLADRRDMSVLTTLDLTHARLDGDGQLALAVLALDGGETSTLQAVAAGAGWGKDTVRARRACNDLVRHSLVTRESGAMDSAKKNRYHLHPLMRRYAIEKQELAGTEAIRHTTIQTRLTDYYLAYAETHARPIAADYDALESELPNLLAAMDRAYQDKQWVQVRRFAHALCDPKSGVLGVRGHRSELRARLDQAIVAARVEGHQRDVAVFTGYLATLLQQTGDPDAAYKMYQQALATLEQLDDREATAKIYRGLGSLAQDTGNYAEARRRYRASLDIEEELGNRAGIALALWGLAMIAQAQGDLGEARRQYEQVLHVFQELGDKRNEAGVLHELGRLAQATGDYAEARRLYQASLDITEELGSRADIAITLHQLGSLAQATGDYAEAHRLYRASLDINADLGNQTGIALALWGLATIAQAQGDLDEARRQYEQALPVFQKLGDKRNEAGVLHQLGLLAQATGDYAEAYRLHSFSLDVAKELRYRTGIAASMHELGILAQATGNYVEARRLYLNSLNISEELGNRADIARTLGELAILTEAEGDQDEAERLYRRMAESIGLFNLARLYEDQGRLNEALPLLERAVEIFERVRSPHAETVRPVLERVRGKLATLQQIEK